jgi:hypothetical protein
MPLILSFCIISSSIFVIPPTSTVVEAKTQYVYIASSGNGKCYHSNSKCSRMKGTVKLTITKAKQRGYRACKKCYR